MGISWCSAAKCIRVISSGQKYVYESKPLLNYIYRSEYTDLRVDSRYNSYFNAGEVPLNMSRPLPKLSHFASQANTILANYVPEYTVQLTQSPNLFCLFTFGYLKSPSVQLDYIRISLNGWMNDNFERIWKKSGRGLTEVPSRHFTGRTEENHVKPVRIADVTPGIRPKYEWKV